MPTVTVLDKLYGSNSSESFEKLYLHMLKGLDVKLRFVGLTDRKWIQLDVSGKDETVALNLLKKEVYFAPTSLVDLQNYPVLRGRAVFSNKTETELLVDLGLPTCDASVSLQRLRAQLCDGKPLGFKNLVKLFCLYNNLPLEIEIVEPTKSGAKTVEASLSEAQLLLFADWVRCRFDRLVVLGSFLFDVQHAIKLSGTFRDIIKVESLGSLEHVVVCKLGTDAVGLIPRIGRYIKSAVLVPFSPKKILETVGNEPFDWRT
ncbi:MAG: DUF2110 family protein [Candidatus Bathyarchaeia archaeon]|jgi:hypothetical protein